MTKLLLAEDVKALGRKGQVVTVKPGYARYLVPKGWAFVATPYTLKLQQRFQEEREKRAIVEKKESEEHAVVLNTLTVKTLVKVDHDGHMYGSVSAGDIAHLIEGAAHVSVDKHSIPVKPIRTVGEHKVPVKLKEGVQATVTLIIEAEEDPHLIKMKEREAELQKDKQRELEKQEAKEAKKRKREHA